MSLPKELFERICTVFFKNIPDIREPYSINICDKRDNTFKEIFFNKKIITAKYSEESITIKNNTSPLIILGISDENYILDIISTRNSNQPIILIEFNPDSIKNFFHKYINLFVNNKNIYLLGTDDFPTFLVQLSDYLYKFSDIIPEFDILINPDELEYIFKDNGSIGKMLRYLIEDLYINVHSYYAYIDYNDFLKPSIIYERLFSTLKLITIASPGISVLTKMIADNLNTEKHTSHLSDNIFLSAQAKKYKNLLSAKEFKKNKVSIIIVAWNQWNATKICIESILQNTHNLNFEIIVVDNGSTDETSEKLKFYEKKYEIIKIITSEKNSGPAGGRDLGTLYSEGEYLIYLDNDVEVRNNAWVSIILKTLNIHPKIGATGAFPVIHTSDKNEDFAQLVLFPGFAVPVCWISGFCAAFKRQAIIDIGGWRPDLFHLWGCEDFAISYALREKGWITVSPLAEISVAHLVQHKDVTFYDYNWKITSKKNNDNFKKIWGNRHRILNAALSNNKISF